MSNSYSLRVFLCASLALASIVPSIGQSHKSSSFESTVVNILNYANYLTGEGKVEEAVRNIDRAISILSHTEDRDSLLAWALLQRVMLYITMVNTPSLFLHI